MSKCYSQPASEKTNVLRMYFDKNSRFRPPISLKPSKDPLTLCCAEMANVPPRVAKAYIQVVQGWILSANLPVLHLPKITIGRDLAAERHNLVTENQRRGYKNVISLARMSFSAAPQAVTYGRYGMGVLAGKIRV